MKQIQDMINPDDIYTEDNDTSYGLEDEPHCTLLYGLHDDVSDDEIRSIISQFKYGTCVVKNPSLFEQDDYDVLKFDVSGENIHETNKRLTDLPHTNSYPDYHPHMTIAYIKSGKGQDYVDMINDSVSEFELLPIHVRYSHPDGTHTDIKI